MRPYQQAEGALLFFGGASDAARELRSEHCDVFLMWPEDELAVRENMRDLSNWAACYGREIDFGYRVHVIVWETESQTREAARWLVSRLDNDTALTVGSRALDEESEGVLRQDALRSRADAGGYVEANRWTGIGRGHSG